MGNIFNISKNRSTEETLATAEENTLTQQSLVEGASFSNPHIYSGFSFFSNKEDSVVLVEDAMSSFLQLLLPTDKSPPILLQSSLPICYLPILYLHSADQANPAFYLLNTNEGNPADSALEDVPNLSRSVPFLQNCLLAQSHQLQRSDDEDPRSYSNDQINPDDGADFHSPAAEVSPDSRTRSPEPIDSTQCRKSNCAPLPVERSYNEDGSEANGERPYEDVNKRHRRPMQISLCETAERKRRRVRECSAPHNRNYNLSPELVILVDDSEMEVPPAKNKKRQEIQQHEEERERPLKRRKKATAHSQRKRRMEYNSSIYSSSIYAELSTNVPDTDGCNSVDSTAVADSKREKYENYEAQSGQLASDVLVCCPPNTRGDSTHNREQPARSTARFHLTFAGTSEEVWPTQPILIVLPMTQTSSGEADFKSLKQTKRDTAQKSSIGNKADNNHVRLGISSTSQAEKNKRRLILPHQQKRPPTDLKGCDLFFGIH